MKTTLAALCMMLAAASAFAQPNEAAQSEMRSALDAANKVAVAGPAEVKLMTEAMLKLPAGMVYIAPAEAGRLLVAMGNRSGEGMLGLVVTPAPDADWFASSCVRQGGLHQGRRRQGLERRRAARRT